MGKNWAVGVCDVNQISNLHWEKNENCGGGSLLQGAKGGMAKIAPFVEQLVLYRHVDDKQQNIIHITKRHTIIFRILTNEFGRHSMVRDKWILARPITND